MRINKQALRRIIKESRLQKKELSEMSWIPLVRILNMFSIQTTAKNYKSMTEIEQILWTINDYQDQFIEVKRKRKVELKDIVIQS